MARLLFLLAPLCWQPAQALAQDGKGPVETVSFAGAMLRMVMALALVLALMLALYWLMRRLSPRQLTSYGAGGLKVWGRLGLGPKKSLALVEVGRKMLVLGLGTHEVVLLREIDDAEEIAEIKNSSGVGFMRRGKGNKGAGFINIFKRKQEDEEG